MKIFINFKLLIPALVILIKTLFSHEKNGKIYKKFRYEFKLNCAFSTKKLNTLNF